MLIPLLVLSVIWVAVSVARMVVGWRNKETVVYTQTPKSMDDTEF
jgi:hypothetical protein